MLFERLQAAQAIPFAATATITAAYLNAHRPERSKPVEPADLIPGARAEHPKPDAASAAATRLAQFRALAATQKKP